MHILLVTTEFPSEKKFIGGLGNYLSRHSSALTNEGHKVEILALSSQNSIETVGRIKIRRISRASRNPLFVILNHLTLKRFHRAASLAANALKICLIIRKISRKQIVEVVQIPSLLPCGVFWKKLLPDIPYVVRISSYRPYWHNEMKVRRTISIRLEEKLERYQLKYSNFIYSPSDTLKNIIEKEESVFGISVIRPPFIIGNIALDSSIYLESLKNKPYILFVGKSELHKGFQVLVNAFLLLKNEIPNAKLVFVGRSMESHYSQDMLDMFSAQKDSFYFIKPLQHTQLFPIFSGAKLVVLPSLIDNIPNTCLEAMSLGKAVIGTRGASFDEIITDSNNGFLVPPGDPQQLYEKLLLAWRHPNLRKVGRLAKRTIEKEFSPSKVTDQVVEYYSKAIKHSLSKSGVQ